MLGYIVRRLFQAVIVIILVTLGITLLLHVLPGGPARAILGPRVNAVQIAQFNHDNGLDQPIWVQYGTYLGQITGLGPVLGGHGCSARSWRRTCPRRCFSSASATPSPSSWRCRWASTRRCAATRSTTTRSPGHRSSSIRCRSSGSASCSSASSRSPCTSCLRWDRRVTTSATCSRSCPR